MAMETEQLKKILTGLSLVSLLAGASLTVTGVVPLRAMAPRAAAVRVPAATKRRRRH
jgi:radical SAM modification target selenobiotic family peptide